MASASGASLKQRGFSAFAATRNRAAAAAKNSQAKPLLRVPAGRWRPRVRGLRASSSASSIRLKVMAAERAPTIATTIQESRHARLPVAKPCSRKASSAAVSANGKANTECSNLIISSVSQILFRMPRAMETPGLPRCSAARGCGGRPVTVTILVHGTAMAGCGDGDGGRSGLSGLRGENRHHGGVQHAHGDAAGRLPGAGRGDDAPRRHAAGDDVPGIIAGGPRHAVYPW